MPTYGYACDEGHKVDLFLSISEHDRVGATVPCPTCGKPARQQFDECQVIGDELRGETVMNRHGVVTRVHGDRFEPALGRHIESKSHLRRVLKESGLVEARRGTTSPGLKRIKVEVNPAKDLPAIAKIVPEVREARLKAAQEGGAVSLPDGWSSAADGGVAHPVGPGS